MNTIAIKSALAALFITFSFSGLLFGNPPVPRGNLVGHVLEQDTEHPLGWANLFISELNRSATAHEDGSFHLFDLPPGVYHLQVFRVGYHQRTIRTEIISGTTSSLDIFLDTEAISTETITIQADSSSGMLDSGSDIHVSGENLRQNLGLTLAETIADEPGINQRSMGPAPARPILRGMGGDRLLILEDGQRTGDLSATSADHAVVIEAINSDVIEVIRGPKALIYGSNTIGGVINVSRDYIPDGKPHVTTGTLSLQGRSANAARAAAAKITLPWQDLAFTVDGSWRKTTDMDTPQGKLVNTDLETYNLSAGAGIYKSWGLAGFSASLYNSQYGIPPLPAELGGHPGGVDIQMKRSHLESKLEFYHSSEWFRRTEINYAFSNYYHAEFHTSGDSPDKTQFGVLTHNLEWRLHIPECFCRKSGVIGIWSEYRDYASSGLNFTPNTTEQALGAYYHHAYQFDKLTLGGTIRYDWRQIRPDEKGYSVFLNGTIRDRLFYGYSASLGAKYVLGKFSTAYNFFKSLRLPGVEELFSEGPHLAAYAYEIGNPELEEEEGFGHEISFNYFSDYFNTRLAFFRNDIYGYIFPENTNQRSIQRNDLFVYRYVGEQAVLQGVEGSLHWHFAQNWYSKAMFSYVHGSLTEQNEAIPRIPPLDYKLTTAYKNAHFSFGVTLKGAAEQERTGSFENPTQGYDLWDINSSYAFAWRGYFHTITVNIENLANSAYYNHTNRVKEIMPEPGRSINILYRAYF